MKGKGVDVKRFHTNLLGKFLKTVDQAKQNKEDDTYLLFRQYFGSDFLVSVSVLSM